MAAESLPACSERDRDSTKLKVFDSRNSTCRKWDKIILLQKNPLSFRQSKENLDSVEEYCEDGIQNCRKLFPGLQLNRIFITGFQNYLRPLTPFFLSFSPFLNQDIYACPATVFQKHIIYFFCLKCPKMEKSYNQNGLYSELHSYLISKIRE